MARLLVLDVVKHKVYEKECNKLQDFYDAIGCDTFDIAHINIGGKYFDCFVDDTGLFKDDIIPSVVTEDNDVLLVGNVVFANHDSAGETTSLSEEDIETIKDSMIFGIDIIKQRFLIGVLGSY